MLLHVKSRGRNLGFLLDLIAFNLQRLRLSVTYDQIPILSKHGLITLAIDGFDELADPDGYELAWSQVNDLVVELRGGGSIILAGRETFIGKERLVSEVAGIRLDEDEVNVLTLAPPSKGDAIKWLQDRGWEQDQIGSVEDFLEPGSLALRPFFLKTLTDPSITRRISETGAKSIMSILIDAMIWREVEKFGEQVNQELSPDDRYDYIANLMMEISRDASENTSDAVSEATLAWLVEFSLTKKVSESTLRLLRARSQAIAFLTNDERSGYKRFYHEKFYEYFLSKSLISTISKGEIGKFLVRGLSASSLLETFTDVVSDTKTLLLESFFEHSKELLDHRPPVDRARSNVSALVLASLSTSNVSVDLILRDVEINEVRMTGVCDPVMISGVVINQFDCRNCDLGAITFDNSSILTIIADNLTVLPESFAMPARIQDVTLSGRSITNPAEVAEWIARHTRNSTNQRDEIIPESLKDHEALNLLYKACRLRQYWLRRGDDIRATRILEDRNWNFLQELLKKHQLIRIEQRPASGTDAQFIHIRYAREILSSSTEIGQVSEFLRDLVLEIQRSTEFLLEQSGRST